MTAHFVPSATTFRGASGNRLAADVFGKAGRPVLMLHGGGQTRHAWRKTADMIGRAGMVATAVDQRGHGDSEWVDDGAYRFADFAADAIVLGEHLGRGGERPVAVGASLGGIACLLAAGDAAVFSGLVLVDITPRVDLEGVAKVQGFMRAHAREGFGSIEEAADAVAAYLPHRPRPRSHEGLRKNLRLHPDGRWRWHWDPRFLDGRRRVDGQNAEVENRMIAAAQSLTIPTLLVRGGASELVKEEHAREFLTHVPHATYVDVSGARHMVAGDRNDEFALAIMKFLNEIG